MLSGLNVVIVSFVFRTGFLTGCWLRPTALPNLAVVFSCVFFSFLILFLPLFFGWILKAIDEPYQALLSIVARNFVVCIFSCVREPRFVVQTGLPPFFVCGLSV